MTDLKTARPRLLWVSCAAPSELHTHSATVRRAFDVATCADFARVGREIRMLEPRVLCFEFDVPSRANLAVVQKVKRTHPSLPILMLTVAHSEELAVWAFRARVWNYLVRPVDPAEFAENLRSLAKIARASMQSRTAYVVDSDRLPNDLAAPLEGRGHQALLPAMRMIETGYQERLRAADLAKACGLDVFAFSRRFHSHSGFTFREFLVRLRLSKACQLLRQPGASVTRVGLAVGFGDASRFAQLFRRHLGVSPSRYARDPGTGRESDLLRPSAEAGPGMTE
jgi:AraC-like DNA-binding protein